MTTAQKAAIVTDASPGIGEGLVNAFRDRGYYVVASSRFDQGLTVHSLGNSGDGQSAGH